MFCKKEMNSRYPRGHWPLQSEDFERDVVETKKLLPLNPINYTS